MITDVPARIRTVRVRGNTQEGANDRQMEEFASPCLLWLREYTASRWRTHRKVRTDKGEVRCVVRCFCSSAMTHRLSLCPLPLPARTGDQSACGKYPPGHSKWIKNTHKGECAGKGKALLPVVFACHQRLFDVLTLCVHPLCHVHQAVDTRMLVHAHVRTLQVGNT